MKFFPYFYIPKMLWQILKCFAGTFHYAQTSHVWKVENVNYFVDMNVEGTFFNWDQTYLLSDHNDFCHAFAVLYYYFLLCVQIYCYFIASTNAKKVPKQIVFTVKAKININDLFILNTCHFLESLKCLFTPFHHM